MCMVLCAPKTQGQKDASHPHPFLASAVATQSITKPQLPHLLCGSSLCPRLSTSTAFTLVYAYSMSHLDVKNFLPDQPLFLPLILLQIAARVTF